MTRQKLTTRIAAICFVACLLVPAVAVAIATACSGTGGETCVFKAGANTLGATEITSTSAHMNGSVEPNGCTTTAAVKWGEKSVSEHEIPVGVGGTGGVVPETVIVSGLKPSTTYRYQIIAKNAANLTGPTEGAVVTFTTSKSSEPPPGEAPAVTTEAATEITTSGALLHASVNPHGLATTYKFEYGTEKGSFKKSTAPVSAGSGSAAVKVSSALSGLEPKTTYFFRGSATNSAGTTTGSEFSFTTATLVTSWTIESSPNPSGALSSGLRFGSCTTSGACTSVGRYVSSGGTQAPLAERWNGTAWTAQLPPNPAGATSGELLGASCTTATACAASGSAVTSGVRGPLAEAWNGSTWTVQSTPTPVGSTFSELTAISCTSSSACTAVGSYSTGGGMVPLAMRWNGASWALQTVPKPVGASEALLFGVSCTSSTACTAVGHYYDGSGARLTLAEFWNGSSWTVQSMPTRAGASLSTLLGVSCTASTACTAVGGDFPSSGPQETLMERWNGVEWTIQASPNPSGSAASVMHGVSCTSATTCTAVGDYVSASVNDTLAERWNGSSWSVMATPNPGGFTFAAMWSVSCTSATVCIAPGYYESSAGTELALIEASS
jgi:hypothetical protein